MIQVESTGTKVLDSRYDDSIAKATASDSGTNNCRPTPVINMAGANTAKRHSIDNKRAGAVFDASDALYLDGGRLIPVAANQNDAIGLHTEYRMEIDDYSRIRGYGNGAKGHDFFMVLFLSFKIRLLFCGSRRSTKKPLRVIKKLPVT